MENLMESKKQGTSSRIVPVDTVFSLTEEEFNRTYYNVKPVLIKGAMKDTNACQLWSLDYLKRKVGQRVVKFAYNEASNFSDAIKDIKWLDGSVEEILDLIAMTREANPFFAYMGQQSIPEKFPELLEDLLKPEFIRDTDFFGDQNIWIGPAGCEAGLHYDNYHNFFCQIKGRKEIALFSPEDSPYLYPCKVQGKQRISEVELQNVDQERFPLFSSAVNVHCIVEPGDMLYMPFGWWHDILTLELSISVNYWWQRFDIPRKGIEYLEIHELCGILKYFMDRGVHIDHKDQEGEFLLLKAINNDYPQIVEALLLMGANPNLKSIKYKPGYSALSIAKENHQNRIIELLLKYGAGEEI